VASPVRGLMFAARNSAARAELSAAVSEAGRTGGAAGGVIRRSVKVWG
jgi:hypothetical protein